MRKKQSKKGLWQNFISIIVGILVIVCIMSFPIVYFRRVDASRYNTRHYMEKITFALDTDVENVMMVKELHRFLKSPYQNDVINAESHLVENTEEFYETASEETKIVTQINDGETLILVYDKKTNKVVQAKYKPKDYNQEKYIRELCTEKGDKELEEEMKRYLKYLGLDVIEDWVYESVWNWYKSEDNGYGKKKIEAYDYFSSNKENWELGWYMSSNSAKLLLRVVPEKDGVKYYFQVCE